MSNFANTKSPTPFGFFDSNQVFQNDADKIVYFVLRKLGEDILSVEISKRMIWACFEEATFVFNAHIIEYQAKSNLASLLGSPTGSVDPNDPNTANTTPNLTDVYIKPNLEFLIRQAEPYAAEIGFGQSKGSASGSILVVEGKQDYDLYTDLVDSAGIPIANQMITGSKGKMKVVEVFHAAPLQYVFNSNLASNFVASGLPVESYVPDTRFYILPLFEDVLRASMLKEAQRTRRSHYRYKISGRQIRFYPIPREFYNGMPQKIWIRVVFPSNPVLDSGQLTVPSGSSPGDPGTDEWTGGVIKPDDTIYGVSNPASLPYGLMAYSSLNPWAKNWIFQYTLALCTELLGRVRGKIDTIPVGGTELKLDGDNLKTTGREDKENLLRGEHGLIAKLESLTYDKLAEMEANKAEQQQKQLQFIPFPPTVNISIR
jgi:hypothetical protein